MPSLKHLQRLVDETGIPAKAGYTGPETRHWYVLVEPPMTKEKQKTIRKACKGYWLHFQERSTGA